jgi:hypothetical protein
MLKKGIELGLGIEPGRAKRSPLSALGGYDADILDKYNTTVSIVSIANDTSIGYSWYARRRKAGPFSTWKPTALIGCHTDVDSTHRRSPARLYQDALQHRSFVALQDQLKVHSSAPRFSSPSHIGSGETYSSNHFPLIFPTKMFY